MNTIVSLSEMLAKNVELDPCLVAFDPSWTGSEGSIASFFFSFFFRSSINTVRLLKWAPLGVIP